MFQHDFQREIEMRKTRHEAFRQEVEDDMRRSERAFKLWGVIWAAVLFVGIGIALFGCWCLYHVLKAKRLIP